MSSSFQNNPEKPQNSDGKTGILRKTSFFIKSIFVHSCILKINHCKCLKFLPNFYIGVVYNILWFNFKNILAFFEIFIDNRNFRFFFYCLLL